MALCIPHFDPGQAITGRASGAAVVGSTFVMVAATKVDGGNVLIKPALAAKYPIGVAAADVADGYTTAVYGSGFVVDVLAGGTGVTAGEAVEVLNTGTIQDLASGHKVGIAITTAAAAAYAKIRITL
jgi:uncharacterized protein DUF2190